MLTACSLALLAAGCSTQPPTPKPVTAVISQVDKGVSLTMAGQANPLPASIGMGMPSGATLTTADQASAAIDFGAGNAVYLQSRTAVTLLRSSLASPAPTAELQVSAGRLVAIMPSGSLKMTTASVQVDLSGSAALVEFTPSALGSDGDVFTLICLGGDCLVNTRVYSGDLSRRDRLTITNSGLTVDHAQLSDADLAALLNAQAGEAVAAATLTAWPPSTTMPVTATPTPPIVSSPTALPSRTLVPVGATPTPQPSLTNTEAFIIVVTATLTSTPLPPPTLSRATLTPPTPAPSPPLTRTPRLSKILLSPPTKPPLP